VLTMATLTITYTAAYLAAIGIFGVGVFSGIVMERIVRRAGEETHR